MKVGSHAIKANLIPVKNVGHCNETIAWDSHIEPVQVVMACHIRKGCESCFYRRQEFKNISTLCLFLVTLTNLLSGSDIAGIKGTGHMMLMEVRELNQGQLRKIATEGSRRIAV